MVRESRILDIAQLTIQQAFHLTFQHQQVGRQQETEQIYRQILARQPNHADAMNLLSVFMAHVNLYDAAVDLLRRAVSIQPANPGWA
jgi:lipoprotein NlpI